MVKTQLPRLLGERAMKQAELSRMTGIRPNTINDLYRGMAESVKFDHLDRICKALDCTLAELLIFIPNPVVETGRAPTWSRAQIKNPRSFLYTL